MKNLLRTLLIVLSLSLSASAQLPNGSTAPDFTLKDLNGDWHNLYSYLADGKVVFIKFFACHCPGCWAYQNTGKLEDLTLAYGESGTNQVVVLMLEHDQYNGMDEFYGNSNWSQGDWVTGNPNAIFNVEGADRSVFTDYNMTYYPMVIKVCPDKTVELMSTSLSVAQLYQEADDCPGTLSVQSDAELEDFHTYFSNGELIYTDLDGINYIEVINSIGQSIVGVPSNSNGRIEVTDFASGFYFVKASGEVGTIVQRVYIP